MADFSNGRITRKGNRFSMTGSVVNGWFGVTHYFCSGRSTSQAYRKKLTAEMKLCNRIADKLRKEAA
jgi:hypothetical protein